MSNERIVYVTPTPEDPRFSYEMSTGNEPGAYEGEWVPGGYTKNGTDEISLIGGDKIKHNSNVDDVSKLLGDNVERL